MQKKGRHVLCCRCWITTHSVTISVLYNKHNESEFFLKQHAELCMLAALFIFEKFVKSFDFGDRFYKFCKKKKKLRIFEIFRIFKTPIFVFALRVFKPSSASIKVNSDNAVLLTRGNENRRSLLILWIIIFKWCIKGCSSNPLETSVKKSFQTSIQKHLDANRRVHSASILSNFMIDWQQQR